MIDKNIIVELDDDGFVTSVWCPDETYVVNVLDRRDQANNALLEIENYYKSLEEEIEKSNMKNCFQLLTKTIIVV